MYGANMEKVSQDLWGRTASLNSAALGNIKRCVADSRQQQRTVCSFCFWERKMKESRPLPIVFKEAQLFRLVSSYDQNKNLLKFIEGCSFIFSSGSRSILSISGLIHKLCFYHPGTFAGHLELRLQSVVCLATSAPWSL